MEPVKKVKLAVVVLLGVMMLFVLGGCDAEEAGSPADEVPTINVSYIMTNHHTPLVAALKDAGNASGEEGVAYIEELTPRQRYELYDGEELVATLNLIESQSGAESATMFAQENIDIGLASSTAMLNGIDKGTNIKIVSPLQNEGIAVVFPEGSGVQGWEEFEGYVEESSDPVRLGYHSPTSAPKILIESALHEMDYTLTHDVQDQDADILLVDLKNTSNLVPSLSSGQVEAMVAPDPTPAVAEEEGVGEIAFQVRDMPPNDKWKDSPCCVTAARDEIIEEYSREMEVFMEVLDYYCEWSNDNMIEAADLTAEFMGISQEAAREAAMSYSVHPTDRWENSMEIYMDTLDDMGMFENELNDENYEDARDLMYDFSFIPSQ